MAEPTIARGGDNLAAAGATEIVVLPYFLAGGRHVNEDIPGAVAHLAQKHPSIKITIARHLGAATGMRELICAHSR